MHLGYGSALSPVFCQFVKRSRNYLKTLIFDPRMLNFRPKLRKTSKDDSKKIGVGKLNGCMFFVPGHFLTTGNAFLPWHIDQQHVNNKYIIWHSKPTCTEHVILRLVTSFSLWIPLTIGNIIQTLYESQKTLIRWKWCEIRSRNASKPNWIPRIKYRLFTSFIFVLGRHCFTCYAQFGEFAAHYTSWKQQMLFDNNLTVYTKL